jgi:hypothetical protein
MKAFDDAGIYLFVDLDDFPTQIEQVWPFFESHVGQAAVDHIITGQSSME